MENETIWEKTVDLLGRISEKVDGVSQNLKVYEKTLINSAESFEISSKMEEKLINDFNKLLNEFLKKNVTLSAFEMNLKEMNYIVQKKYDECMVLFDALSEDEKEKFIESLTYFQEESNKKSAKEEKSYFFSISDMYGVLLPIIEEAKEEAKEKTKEKETKTN
jgi:hypothetical protein